MKYIELSQGQRAKVDDGDFDWLNQWKWCAEWNRETRSFYAVRKSDLVDGKRHHVCMHRLVLGCLPGRLTDHKDHDTLNNQRYNLRIATNAQNQHNQKARKGSSIYKGVTWHKRDERWAAGIVCDMKRHSLGYFTNERDAALAYDAKARELFGEFACTNF
jgi:hypothetical protein